MFPKDTFVCFGFFSLRSFIIVRYLVQYRHQPLLVVPVATTNFLKKAPLKQIIPVIYELHKELHIFSYHLSLLTLTDILHLMYY